jgi:hypothetical protein
MALASSGVPRSPFGVDATFGAAGVAVDLDIGSLLVGGFTVGDLEQVATNRTNRTNDRFFFTELTSY